MKPTDNKIVIDLIKKTRKGEINWYKSKLTNSQEQVWISTDKITATKALAYMIFSNRNDPEKSRLTINMEKRVYDENGSIRSAATMARIRTINLFSVIFLLRVAIESAGYKIQRYTTVIIPDKNSILLSKRMDPVYGYVTYGLPYSLSNKDNIKQEINDTVKTTVGIDIISKEMIRYKNIVENKNGYFYISTYLATDYDMTNYKHGTFIKDDNIFNINMDKNSLDTIRYYLKHKDDYKVPDINSTVNPQILFDDLRTIKRKFKYINSKNEFDYLMDSLYSLLTKNIRGKVGDVRINFDKLIGKVIQDLRIQFPEWYNDYIKRKDVL